MESEEVDGVLSPPTKRICNQDTKIKFKDKDNDINKDRLSPDLSENIKTNGKLKNIFKRKTTVVDKNSQVLSRYVVFIFLPVNLFKTNHVILFFVQNKHFYLQIFIQLP